MKPAIINEHYRLVVPDTIADWDAISHWERARFQSYKQHLRWGDLFVDVGAEHGWMSAVIGREYVGPENMVLIEPSLEMWRDIWLTWLYNDFPDPAGSWVGFVSDDEHIQSHPKHEAPKIGVWPVQATAGYEECPAMPYRSLLRDPQIPSMPLDQLQQVGVIPRRVDAMSIDVEGAEMLVLWGAEQILRRDRPLMWVSIHEGREGFAEERSMIQEDFGHTREQILDFMAGLDYTHEFLEYHHEEHWLFAPAEGRS